MGFGDAIASCFNKYANFSGRAPRSEYWWWFLFVVLISAGIGIIGGVLDVTTGHKVVGAALRGLLDLFVLLPNLAVGVRRLHDLNRSGWWMGASIILSLFILILVIPIAIRMAENHANGISSIDGIPMAAIAVIAILGLVEMVIGLMIFIWFLLRGTNGSNRFGPDPLRAF
jgi:uncharacterized membrane protein YhaH (DUF805 family)